MSDYLYINQWFWSAREWLCNIIQVLGKFNQRGGEAPELVKLSQNLDNVAQPLEGVPKPFVNNIVTRTKNWQV